MTFSVSREALAVVALALCVVSGCGRADDAAPILAHHGPHGGHLAVMSEGAGFAIEFTLDARTRRMVLYVQDPGGAEPHPLAADSLSGRLEAGGQGVDVTFAADPRPEDPEGRASRFALSLDDVPQQLLASNDFVLTISHTADGQAVTASIPHGGDHGHKYRHD